MFLILLNNDLCLVISTKNKLMRNSFKLPVLLSLIKISEIYEYANLSSVYVNWMFPYHTEGAASVMKTDVCHQWLYVTWCVFESPEGDISVNKQKEKIILILSIQDLNQTPLFDFSAYKQSAGVSSRLFWYMNTWKLAFSWVLQGCVPPELWFSVQLSAVLCWCSFLTVKHWNICSSLWKQSSCMICLVVEGRSSGCRVDVDQR